MKTLQSTAHLVGTGKFEMSNEAWGAVMGEEFTRIYTRNKYLVPTYSTYTYMAHLQHIIAGDRYLYTQGYLLLIHK